MNFFKKIWVFHMGGGLDFYVWDCSLEKKMEERCRKSSF